jgi:uncharacterized cofD-like protein
VTAEPSRLGGVESAPIPRDVVALGGGTGMPAVLRGLRPFVQDGKMSTLTAVVAMTDDGGSSGRLRRSRGLLPPGDLRNCLVALSCEEDLLAGLFQHRYDGVDDVGGHTAGNLILAALSEMTGSFLKAVELSSRVLRTSGRILPVTLQDSTLEAELEDGTWAIGESAIGSCAKRIRRIGLKPAGTEPTPGVVEAILAADMVVLGPGSLYTSVVPNLLVPAVAGAVRATAATVVLVANLVSERGQAADLGLADQVAILEEVAGGRLVDAVLVHEGPIDEATISRYRAEGATPLAWSRDAREERAIVRKNLLATGPKLRHDPAATVDGLFAAWRTVRVSPA